MELKFLKREEDLGFGTATTHAVTSPKRSVLIRTNTLSPVIEVTLHDTDRIGQGYQDAPKEEALKALLEVEPVISGFIKAMIAPEKGENL